MKKTPKPKAAATGKAPSGKASAGRFASHANGFGLTPWDPSLHPRDEEGHWVLTPNELRRRRDRRRHRRHRFGRRRRRDDGAPHIVRRIKEGTPESRQKLAAQIRQRRAQVKTKEERRKLVEKVRMARKVRRKQPHRLKDPHAPNGHWITTAGGVRRLQEGTRAERKKLAAKLRKRRAKATTKEQRQELHKITREARQQRRLTAPSYDAQRRHWADDHERKIAGILGGKRLDDYEPHDILLRRPGATHEDAIEVKTLIDGDHDSFSVANWALIRKVDDAIDNNRVYHTVVCDTRDGKVAVYYKRACGSYSLSSMHKVESPEELRRLIAMSDAELPAAAKGDFPKGQELANRRAAALKERPRIIARSKEYNARKRAEKEEI